MVILKIQNVRRLNIIKKKIQPIVDKNVFSSDASDEENDITNDGILNILMYYRVISSQINTDLSNINLNNLIKLKNILDMEDSVFQKSQKYILKLKEN